VKAPEASAASASRRLAVRSRSRGEPKGSRITAPRAPQRAASAPACKAAAASRALTSSSRPGSRPSSASPVACSRPVSKPSASCRTQRTGRPPAARQARPSASPVAAGRSAVPAAWISCSAARAMPPISRASSPGTPKASRSAGSGWPGATKERPRRSSARGGKAGDMKRFRQSFSICSHASRIRAEKRVILAGARREWERPVRGRPPWASPKVGEPQRRVSIATISTSL